MFLNKYQRAWSHNVVFLNFDERVGGVYQRDDLLTVADIAHELNICFIVDQPPVNPALWTPALLLNIPTPSAQKLIILDPENVNPFPTPATVDRPNDPTPKPKPGTDIHEYEFVFHLDCGRLGEPHNIDDRCIYRQKSMVKHRNDQRYMGLGSKSTDARVTAFPTRSSPAISRSRSSSLTDTSSQSRTSSLKRESIQPSRSSSPMLDAAPIPDERSEISPAERLRMHSIMNQYATNLFQSCLNCAVTGEGNYFGVQGPGLEAAHVVPQSQWNVYPVYGGIADYDNPEELRMAWKKTWDFRYNGIMLLSMIHKCFDARLIAFHPKTHRIRVFVRYSTLNKYHNEEAELTSTIPEAVWQHHWDMCCLENTVDIGLIDLSQPPREPPRSKALKLDHGNPTKQGSSLKAIDTQAADSQATDTPEINIEYGRGRPRKRKGCTATEGLAEDRDGAHGAKMQRLD